MATSTIPQDFIDQLTNECDIVALIGNAVQLKKNGKGFKACCPFHDEKTPSFNVDPVKKYYHCFGCGEGGNALNWLQNYERMGFVDAVKKLAAVQGILVPNISDDFNKKNPPTSSNPNATADAYMRDIRRFDLADIKGWYRQGSFHHHGSSKGTATVQFDINRADDIWVARFCCSWANYLRGTLQQLQKAFTGIGGADLVIFGNVPQGAGLSSSASFEIAILKAFTEAYNLPLDGVQAARLGQQAENEFVGCNCGIMDQFISALASKEHAMLLDCRNLNYQQIPMLDDLAIVIINSNVKRGLVDSEYNSRRQQCEMVAKHFDKPALRDVSYADLLAEQASLDSVLFRRAKHVISENERTVAATTAFQHNDIHALSGLMAASHRSLQQDFETSVPAMDMLVDLTQSVLGSAGGVRMTGGGFGGCVVALAPEQAVDDIKQVVSKHYHTKVGLKADIYVCQTSAGAFL